MLRTLPVVPVVLCVSLAGGPRAQDLATVAPEDDAPIGYTRATLVAGPDELTPAPDDRRRLALEIWYPAKDGGRRKPWASAAMGRAASSQFPFPEGFEKRIATRSFVDAPPREGRFPLVVFSHGLTFPVTLYQSFTEDLASRGYVVVAVNHPHGASLIEYGDGTSLDDSAFPKLEEAAQEAYLVGVARLWAEDLGFVLTAVQQEALPLHGSIDRQRIGVVGHSLGGTAAGLMSRDARVRAVAVMEGKVRGPEDPGKHGRLTVGAPLLHLIGGYNRIDLEVGDYRPGDQAPVYTAVINGTGHAHFSDLIHLYRAFADAGWRARHRYELEPDRVIRIARDYLAAFFDVYLRGGEASVLLRPVGYAARVDGPRVAGYPEVELTIAVK